MTPSRILNQWMYSTMLIKNEFDRLGTGFAVKRLFKNNKKKGKTFLVTNKHVLGSKREQMRSITLGVNVNLGGIIDKHELQMTLHSPDGKKAWR
jgi:hypothetical protein